MQDGQPAAKVTVAGRSTEPIRKLHSQSLCLVLLIVIILVIVSGDHEQEYDHEHEAIMATAQ